VRFSPAEGEFSVRRDRPSSKASASGPGRFADRVVEERAAVLSLEKVHAPTVSSRLPGWVTKTVRGAEDALARIRHSP
jgi:hypothetical protein